MELNYSNLKLLGMTTDQNKKLQQILIIMDTATLDDVKRAIGAEVILLTTIEEVNIFIEAFRAGLKNSPSDQTGSDITIMLSDELRNNLSLIAKGTKMINHFTSWFTTLRECYIPEPKHYD